MNLEVQISVFFVFIVVKFHKVVYENLDFYLALNVKFYF